jgi:hypothetical protein
MRLYSAALILLGYGAVAHAHANLVSPTPRNNIANKTGPCGGIPRTSNPHVAHVGSTLQVDWVETVDHPGYYRLLFSMAGDQNFQVLKDNIPDRSFAPGTSMNSYTDTVTLPSMTCTDCTLQLIQVMAENPAAPSYYYSCADIKLVPQSADLAVLADLATPAGDDMAVAPMDLSAQRSDAAATPGPPPASAQSAGGCAIAPGSSGSTVGGIMLMALAWLSRRRTARRTSCPVRLSR